MTQTNRMTVANEILAQLGGNKFLVMTGAANLAADTNKLTMTIPTNKSKTKRVTITLNSMDTYDMEFIGITRKLDKEMAALGMKIYETAFFTVAKYEGIYADMLQTIFTKVTGMYTRL